MASSLLSVGRHPPPLPRPHVRVTRAEHGPDRTRLRTPAEQRASGEFKAPTGRASVRPFRRAGPRRRHGPRTCSGPTANFGKQRARRAWGGETRRLRSGSSDHCPDLGPTLWLAGLSRQRGTLARATLAPGRGDTHPRFACLHHPHSLIPVIPTFAECVPCRALQNTSGAGGRRVAANPPGPSYILPLNPVTWCGAAAARARAGACGGVQQVRGPQLPRYPRPPRTQRTQCPGDRGPWTARRAAASRCRPRDGTAEEARNVSGACMLLSDARLREGNGTEEIGPPLSGATCARARGVDLDCQPAAARSWRKLARQRQRTKIAGWARTRPLLRRRAGREEAWDCCWVYVQSHGTRASGSRRYASRQI